MHYTRNILIIMLCWNSLYGSSESPKLAQHDGAQVSLSYERVMERKEHYLALCKRADRNKKLLYFTGGLCAAGFITYMVKHYFFPDPIKAPRRLLKDDADYSLDQIRKNYYDDWLAQQRERRTFRGAIKHAALDGARSAVGAVIAAIVLRQIDNATFNIGGKVKRLIGYEGDEIFSVVQQRVGENIDHVSHSFEQLITELAFLAQNGTKKESIIPSFFFGFLTGDARALCMHVEELAGLMMALGEFFKPGNKEVEQAVYYQAQVLLRAQQDMINLLSLIKSNKVPQDEHRIQALYAIKRLSVALRDCISFAQNRLFA